MSVVSSPAPRAFVAGWPIAHSRSPLIHRHWLDALGLAGSYESVAVAPLDFARFARALADQGFVGGNVTVPLKERAYAYADEKTEMARRIGAANTLWLENGRLCADNTDAAGFLAALDDEIPGWDDVGGDAVVIGAGGAARAVVAALLSRGRDVTVVNRTLENAQSISSSFRGLPVARDWGGLDAALRGAGLVVNATTLGMKGEPPLEVDLAPLRADAVVADIIYTPLETRLVAQARARGLRASGGLGMLLRQAAPAFARFFGATPEVTPELRRLVEADVEKAA
ncbi:shikimate dehydrogenase [Methylocella sp.]|uniref:shikimate dehydrogenase n=1 Tax=Methylocella sp. TaxID=1978226 RepID=UPI00378452B9